MSGIVIVFYNLGTGLRFKASQLQNALTGILDGPARARGLNQTKFDTSTFVRTIVTCLLVAFAHARNAGQPDKFRLATRDLNDAALERYTAFLSQIGIDPPDVKRKRPIAAEVPCSQDSAGVPRVLVRARLNYSASCVCA